eukprot:scaffold13014_cov57-Attheya_sp.AAC.8
MDCSKVLGSCTANIIIYVCVCVCKPATATSVLAQQWVVELQPEQGAEDDIFMKKSGNNNPTHHVE